MNKKLKLGFIGTGKMGRNHIDVMAKHFFNKCRISIICDENSRELEKAEKLTPGAKILSRWEDVLNEDVDVVIIPLRNFLYKRGIKYEQSE